MFAAIVRSDQDIMALASTLASLVEGAAAGLIGHAVVILPEGVSASPPARAPAPAHDLVRLAEATGADIVNASGNLQADWRAAGLIARGDWLVTLNAGEIFSHGWIAAIERHAMASGGRPGFAARLGWCGISDMVQARLFPANIQSGFVMPRALMLSTGPAPHTKGLIRLKIWRESAG